MGKIAMETDIFTIVALESGQQSHVERAQVIDIIGSVTLNIMGLPYDQCPLLHTVRYRPTTVDTFVTPCLTAPTVVGFDTLHAAQPYDKTFRKLQLHAVPLPFLKPVTKLVINVSYNGGRVWPSLDVKRNPSLSAVVIVFTNPMRPMTTTLDPVMHAVVIRHTAPLLQDIATGIKCRIDGHCPHLTITLVDSNIVHPACFGPTVEDNRSKGNAAMALAIRQQVQRHLCEFGVSGEMAKEATGDALRFMTLAEYRATLEPHQAKLETVMECWK
jgi:hypothetical protein